MSATSNYEKAEWILSYVDEKNLAQTPTEMLTQAAVLALLAITDGLEALYEVEANR